jgi:ATP-dependent DNA helicase RecG
MYSEKESATLELKQQETKSFPKTVCAFANYCDGRIIFGVKKDGTISGIHDPEKFRLQIENVINDTIDPRPDFQLRTDDFEGKYLVELSVDKGLNTPYTYNGAAYKRSDTSSVPVDANELRRLSLEGVNITYDQLPSTEVNLSFEKLKRLLKEKIGIKHFSEDTLRTLGLLQKGNFTRAAQLLADENQVNQSITTIIRFGGNASIFLERVDIVGKSLLTQYDEALKMFSKWYKPYEKIVGFERIQREQIPQEAFREGVANALVHRRYDINAAIQIAMYEDRIEITSPGGLPPGITKTSYIFGQVSILRNLVIAEVFYRLGLIEKFGTGIFRIRESYAAYHQIPQFDLSDDYIRVILPVVDYDAVKEEKDISTLILMALSKHGLLSRSQLEEFTGYQRSWLSEILKRMVNEGILEVVGRGPQTRYQIK